MEQVYNKFCRKIQKKFGDYKKVCAVAIPFEGYAKTAQLADPNLAKVGVASSSLVFRSKRVSRNDVICSSRSGGRLRRGIRRRPH